MALGERLASAGRRIEKAFLELGGELEAAVAIVGRLIGSLDQVSQMLNAETVEQTTAALADAAGRLELLSAAHQRRNDRFQVLLSGSAGLTAHLDEMRRTLGYLKAFTVNIKITASGIPDARTEFAAFAEELQAAIAQADRELDEFAAELAELMNLIGAATQQERNLEVHCAETLPALARRLAADAQAIAAHHRRISGFAEQVKALAYRVQGRIAEAVVALQIADTTRQRIEHVTLGLDILAKSSSASDRARVDPIISRLLAAHLTDAAADFRRELEALDDSMAGVAADIAEAFSPHARTGQSEGSGQTLTYLEASLAEAMSLAHEMETAKRAADDVGRAAERTAGELIKRIGSIRSIRNAIQHQAVNAHLKCCRIGDAGKPLSVIAIELRTQVNELESSADTTELALAALGADRVEAQAHEEDASAGAAELLHSAAEPIRLVSSLVTTELTSLATEAGQAAQTLRGAVGRLNIRREIGEVLGEVSDALAALCGAEPDARSTDVEQSATILGEIAHSYTMPQERQIHAAFVAALPAEVVAQAA